MYEITFHKAVRKDIKNFSKELQKVIKYKHIEEIRKSPLSFPHLKGTLKKFKKYTFRYKGVDYRIVYKIEKPAIKIYIIKKREDVHQTILHRLNF